VSLLHADLVSDVDSAMQKWITAIAVSVCFAHVSEAQQYVAIRGGNELLAECQSATPFFQGTCAGFVIGAFDTLS